MRGFKEILQDTSIFWQLFLSIPENAYGFEHFTINMAIIYQCNPELSPE